MSHTRFLGHFAAGLAILLSATIAVRSQDVSNPSPAPNSQSTGQAAGQQDSVINELALIRKALQSLNTRLKENNDAFSANTPSRGDSNSAVGKLSASFDLLNKAEQRAEILRRELLDLVERESRYKSRFAQLDEDMRPENIDRSLSLVGTTRTYELREAKRKSLEIERSGLDTLLRQTSQSRSRLEDDVRQADAMVARIRERLLPKIESQIDKLTPEAR